MIDRALRHIARRIIVRQHERMPRLKHNRAILELTEAHLRSLRIEQKRHDLPRLLRRLAHAVDALQMLLMRTMRKVEARDIHAVLNKLFHHPRRIRRRPLRANDLRLFVQHTSSSIPKTHETERFSFHPHHLLYCTTIS